MKSGCQTQKLEREEDSSPHNGNSKHRCENNGSSTSGREGMSNKENTHSGKYCVIFLFKNIPGINNFIQNKKKPSKLGSGVCLLGAYHTTLAFHLNKFFCINQASVASPTHTCLIEILVY